MRERIGRLHRLVSRPKRVGALLFDLWGMMSLWIWAILWGLRYIDISRVGGLPSNLWSSIDLD